MSSPGSGKTSVLIALINRLKDRLNIGEMDVDIESSLDAVCDWILKETKAVKSRKR